VSATVDVNVLVHATNLRDPHFEASNALISHLVNGPGLLHLFWPALLGWVRISTHPRILPRPIAISDAVANVDALLAQPNVRVHGEADDAWSRIRAAQFEAGGGNDVPDAHLVALMRMHGVPVIYTQDRGFRRFDDIEVRRIPGT
jgi:toxin-antitoxin system PIN domain toxin